TGLPKLRIEEAAARRQAHIDSGKEAIIGVNTLRLDRVDTLETREVDNTAVRDSQIIRLQKLKSDRDNAKVQGCLEAIGKAAETGEGNLLALSVDAARARATLGEISYALEKKFQRHKAVIRTVSGVYQSEFGADPKIKAVCALTDAFAAKHGRRPRILVAKMGQDGHDRGAKVVATAYADFGFDVDIGPLFQQPGEAARMAVENDVHVVGISSLAGGHKTLLVQLREELAALGRGDIMVVVGGVVPPADHDFLKSHGAAAVFGPGTFIPDAAKQMIEELDRTLSCE
ncbi:MAG: methylmalonyl-CoA mutase family protein, partial [Terrimicrobiaceae bacterium]